MCMCVCVCARDLTKMRRIPIAARLPHWQSCLRTRTRRISSFCRAVTIVFLLAGAGAAAVLSVWRWILFPTNREKKYIYFSYRVFERAHTRTRDPILIIRSEYYFLDCLLVAKHMAKVHKYRPGGNLPKKFNKPKEQKSSAFQESEQEFEVWKRKHVVGPAGSWTFAPYKRKTKRRSQPESYIEMCVWIYFSSVF